jgi:hypothetical protein
VQNGYRGFVAGKTRRVPPRAWVYLGFNLVLATGLPLAILGVVTGAHPLKIAGVILFVVFVLDTAIVFPALRRRRR